MTAFIRIKAETAQVDAEAKRVRARLARALGSIPTKVTFNTAQITRDAQRAGQLARTAFQRGFGGAVGGVAGAGAAGAAPFAAAVGSGGRAGGVAPIFAGGARAAPRRPVTPVFGGGGGRGPTILPGGGGGGMGGAVGGGRFRGLGGLGAGGSFAAGFGFQVAPRLTAAGAFGGAAGLAGAAVGGAALAGGALVASSAKAFADFESAIKNVEIIQREAGATAAEIAKLEKQAREMGQTTIFSATDAAAAMGVLSRAGLDATETFKSLPTVLNLATAADLEIERAAAITVATLKQFNLEIEESARVADVLTKASLMAKTTVGDLAQGLSFAGPVAQTLGMNLEETASALALLQDAGIPATRAGRGLAAVLSQLAKEKTAANFRALGIEIRDANNELRPLADILDATRDALGENASKTEQLAFFMKELDRVGGRTFATLLTRGGPALRDFEKEVEKAGGTVDRIAEEKLKTMEARLKLLSDAWEELKITLGSAVAPALTAMLGLITDVTTNVTDAGKAVGSLARKFSLFPDLFNDFSIGFLRIATPIGRLITVFEAFNEILGITANLAELAARNLQDVDADGPQGRPTGVFGIEQNVLFEQGVRTLGDKFQELAGALISPIDNLRKFNEVLEEILDLAPGGKMDQEAREKALNAELRKGGIRRELKDKPLADAERAQDRFAQSVQSRKKRIEGLEKELTEERKRAQDEDLLSLFGAPTFKESTLKARLIRERSALAGEEEDLRTVIEKRRALRDKGLSDLEKQEAVAVDPRESKRRRLVASKRVSQLLEIERNRPVEAPTPLGFNPENEAAREDRFKRAERINESLKTPLEQLRDELREISDLARDRGPGVGAALSPEEAQRARAQAIGRALPDRERFRSQFVGIKDLAKQIQLGVLGKDSQKLDKDNLAATIATQKNTADIVKAVKDLDTGGTFQ